MEETEVKKEFDKGHGGGKQIFNKKVVKIQETTIIHCR